MAHGGGGRKMHQLIEDVIRPHFPSSIAALHDSAVLNLGPGRVAFTTDSYVVSPLFFPGGDIGRLAVFGTVNDLAMAGARPQYLSVGFIIEEGLPVEVLQRVVKSMGTAARVAEVELVTGDTKVVDYRHADQLFINTAGVGVVAEGLHISPAEVKPKDAIVVSGDLGRHGLSILSVREGLEFETPIESDCAPLASMVLRLCEAGIHIHCLRDLTRGGLASALNEIAIEANYEMTIDEARVPVSNEVRGACEILGLDPLYVPNEGRFVLYLPADEVDIALDILRSQPQGNQAAAIGQVGFEQAARVVLKSVLGPTRILDFLSGEQLPRIC